MVTIKDLAARLGVSPSTITRALADSSRISARTKALVQRTAAEMGYVANTAAKTMRSQQSTLIGLIIPDIENSFYALIAKAFSGVCNQHAFQLMLAVSEDEPDVEERHIEELVSARCAGIAIVPTPDLSHRSSSLLAGRNVAQLIRRWPGLEADWYGVKDDDALESAVKFLINLKHRRIGLICGSDAYTSGRARYQGYVSALTQAGIDLESDLIFRGAPRQKFGQSAANRLRGLRHPPTAIVAAGAGLTEGMLNEAAMWNDDGAASRPISLVGYGDCPAFRWWKGGGLTTVDLPIHQMASDMCINLIQRSTAVGESPLPVQSHQYTSHLIVRGSVESNVID